jgi:hypothetical protein
MIKQTKILLFLVMYPEHQLKFQIIHKIIRISFIMF